MTHPAQLRALIFDVGDTLVHAEPPGTAVAGLVARPMAGAVGDLRGLRGRFRLGAVTDTAVMTADQVRAALAGTGLEELLEVIVTSADIGATKPDPRGLRAVLRRFGTSPAEALFVGDAEVDRGAAQAAGVGFVAVRPGQGITAAIRSHLTAASDPFSAACALVGPADEQAVAATRARDAQLTKPPGSLGRLEALAAQLAGIAGTCPPPVPSPPAVAVFAADHGVVAEGVTAWPQEVTTQMVHNLVAGNAAVNVLARQVGATVTVVDVGVAGDLGALAGHRGLRHHKVRRGTANLARRPAMEAEEVAAALAVGAQVAAELVDGGARCLITGDMGIGNTTASAAVIAAVTGLAPREVTGTGAGVDDEGWARKVAVIEQAVARLGPDRSPRDVLAEVGGLEIAALTGFIVGGASHRVPVLIDGVIAMAALVLAHGLAPDVLAHVVAGHRSVEPGSAAALDHLGLEPVLDLGLRLGEGTGAVLAHPILQAAARTCAEMATFADLAPGGPTGPH